MSNDSESRNTFTASQLPAERPWKPFEAPDRFEIVRPLGRGGQGSVWLADDRVLDQRVALKVLELEARGRAVLEARVGRDLSHPNLIRIFDLVEHGEHLILVMEWLPGGSVKDALTDRPLPIAEIIEIAGQVLEALAYLHERGVVHRDVKPSNLLRDRSGRIKLGDLGLVRELDRSQAMTRTGLTIGTPDYMSPEQLRGEEPAPPADLYGLGATLYELLTGARPFTGSSDLEVARQHLDTPPPNVRHLRPDCPRWLSALVARLLEKNSRDRWRDGAAALAALRSRRAPRWRLWRRRAAAAATLAVVSGAAWAAVDRLQPKLARVAFEDTHVSGLDEDGRKLWRRTFDHRVTVPLLADIAPNRGFEVAVGILEVDPETGIVKAILSVLDSDGSEIRRLWVRPDDIEKWYPHISQDLQFGPLSQGDLDGDGHPELVWSAHHPEWFPNIVGVWWGRRGGILQTVFVNSGRIFEMRTGDTDGDGKAEIVATGINNMIGYQSVVAVIDTTSKLVSPDLLAFDGIFAQQGFFPLGPYEGTLKIESITTDAISFRAPYGSIELPLGDGEFTAPQRQAYWSQLAALCRDAEAQPEEAQGRLTEFRTTNATALAEPGMRLATNLLIARSLARAGDHQGAIKVLREGVKDEPEHTDLWLRLGEQQLIAGNREAGWASLQRSMVARTVGRNPYDGLLLLSLDAALTGSEPDREKARLFWSSYGYGGSADIHVLPLERLAAFFAGRWHDPLLDPGYEVTGFYRPVGVIEPWARMERGADPEAIAREASQVARNPEIREPAQLLQALALHRTGRNDEALKLAREALEVLRTRGREHYEHFVWVPVGEWVVGTILSATGEADQAQEHFARAARTAPGSFFADRRSPL